MNDLMLQRRIFYDIEIVSSADPNMVGLADERAARLAIQKAIEPPPPGEGIKDFAVKNGIYSRLVSIAWAIGDGPVQYREARTPDEEFDILDEFGEAAANKVLVGYNVMQFDNPQLWQRAIVLGVDSVKGYVPGPSVAPWQAKNVEDLAYLWNGARGAPVPQYHLAVALGVATKEEAGRFGNGGQVAEWVATGDWRALREHNEFDIYVTRGIWLVLRHGDEGRELAGRLKRRWYEQGSLRGDRERHGTFVLEAKRA